MNTGKKAARQFIYWLFYGLAAGVVLAAVLSYHEYQTVAGIAGAVMQSELSVQRAENDMDTGVEITGERHGKSPETLQEVLARSLKGNSEDYESDGKAFLEAYGYRPLRNWGAYLPFTTGISVLLFQLAGFAVFWVQYREELRIKRRIRELTEYLRAVNVGEGTALCRNEDIFSHLEDEMYKTVMELRSVKEAAVKNHEVLAERIADIAHQLKTPLTSMSLMTELLEEYQTGETQEYYTRLSNQIIRLKNLVSGLLSLAKLDSHGIVFREERLELSGVVESAAESLEDMMSEYRITFTIRKNNPKKAEAFEMPETYDIPGANQETGCFIYADRQWTEEALMNVLKNCVEHTPQDGRITVTYNQNPIYTELKIEDGGDGFAPEDLPHIFERFYRGTGAAKDNVGIGLALAKAVLEQQNGQISAENTTNGHACFRIKWYAA